MRILLTTHQFLPQFAAGTEILTYSVARELIKRGHVVHVLTGHPDSVDMSDEDRFDEYDFEGIHVYRFHHAYTPMGGQVSMIEVGYDNHLGASYFERILKQFKPDVVHFFHLNRLGTGLIECAIHSGIPCFMTPTDFWTICPTGQLLLGDGSLCAGPGAHAGNCVKHIASNRYKGLINTVVNLVPTSLVDLLSNWTAAGYFPAYPHHSDVIALHNRLKKNILRLNKLHKILSPNRFMTEILMKNGIDSELIIQSAYGIDIEVTNKSGQRTAPLHPFRIGFIGTLAMHKGCHVLIEAFNKLPSNLAVLKIYGNLEDSPEYSALLTKISAGNNSIEFCGNFPNSEISGIFAGLDALVVPSLWYENTPLVVYSAQSVHCPVVATDLPGMSEVIQNEVNGLLFEAGNSSALTNVLLRLITEQGLAEYLGTRSMKPKSTATYVGELLDIWCAP